MNKIWLYSDTHFFHNNVIKYDSLPFKDEFEMNEYIINKWNSRIGLDDSVVHLGDFFVGSNVTNEVRKFLFSRLNGNISLIRGNHDKKDDDWYINIGFKDVQDFYIIDKYFFCHYPIHNIPTYLTNNKIIDMIKKLIIEYEKHKCEYIFHGHTHRYPILNKNHYNCGGVLHDYEPINFNEKIKELNWD